MTIHVSTRLQSVLTEAVLSRSERATLVRAAVMGGVIGQGFAKNSVRALPR